MVLTVRQRGQLLPGADAEAIDEVIAVVWFDRDEESGPWGGIVEPEAAGPQLRTQVGGGQKRYWLRLMDGREGMVELQLSQFEADGAHPLCFSGVGSLARPERP
jgi:hypothetical protein